MGKGNLFLGQGRGKLGDSVFYLKNGQQAFRVRRRQIANPNTTGMLVQRAIMATVMQAYSFGKAIFDHSFQGQKVGEGSQSKFMSVNLRKLRNAYFADVATMQDPGYDPTDLVGRFVARGSTVPVGWTYQISEGTFKAPVANITTGASATIYWPGLASGAETPRDYFMRLGINEGDINTLCIFANGSPSADDNSYDTPVSAAEFVFVRFVAKALPAADAVWSGKRFSDFFTIDSNSYRQTVADEIGSTPFAPAVGSTVAYDLGDCLSETQDVKVTYAGVIASRSDQGLRSDSVMIPIQSTVGLTADYLLDYWKVDTSKVQSDLILEGGGL